MATADSTVTYKDIAGFPGYRVGDDGSVWSCWRQKGKGRACGTAFLMSAAHWHPLKPSPTGNGYLTASLSRNKKVYKRSVHRLVLEAFVGPRPPGMQARHYPDRDPANNRLDNLCWGTPQRNQDDRKEHGTHCQGERNPQAKLTAEKVRAIRAEFAAGGVTKAALARKYGVSGAKVGQIIMRQAWAHLPTS